MRMLNAQATISINWMIIISVIRMIFSHHIIIKYVINKTLALMSF